MQIFLLFFIELILFLSGHRRIIGFLARISVDLYL